MEINVDSKTRGPAKKLLTFCGLPAATVRTMTVADLSISLRRCINQGLITEAQVERALGMEQQKQDTDYQHEGGRKNSYEGKSQDDDFENEGNREDSGADGSSEDGSDGESDSDSEDNGEDSEDSESNSEDSEEGSEASDADSASESDDDSEDGDYEPESEGSGNGQDDKEEERDGKHEAFPRVLKYIKAGLNVALVGPAGTGKSFIARQVADELDKDFFVNGAMMSKYDLIGYCDAHGTYHETPAYQAFKDGGVHCFDELDASAPDAVVAFNGMTDDQPFYTFPVGQVTQSDGYVAIACMNTWGNGASADYVGRYKQDAASMSRFVKVFVGYDANVERMVAGKHTDILERVTTLREACEQLGIRHIVSTRMIVQAVKAREVGKATKKEIDQDVLFAGLDEGAIEQLRSKMTEIARAKDLSK